MLGQTVTAAPSLPNAPESSKESMALDMMDHILPMVSSTCLETLMPLRSLNRLVRHQLTDKAKSAVSLTRASRGGKGGFHHRATRKRRIESSPSESESTCESVSQPQTQVIDHDSSVKKRPVRQARKQVTSYVEPWVASDEESTTAVTTTPSVSSVSQTPLDFQSVTSSMPSTTTSSTVTSPPSIQSRPSTATPLVPFSSATSAIPSLYAENLCIRHVRVAKFIAGCLKALKEVTNPSSAVEKKSCFQIVPPMTGKSLNPSLNQTRTKPVMKNTIRTGNKEESFISNYSTIPSNMSSSAMPPNLLTNMTSSLTNLPFTTTVPSQSIPLIPSIGSIASLNSLPTTNAPPPLACISPPPLNANAMNAPLQQQHQPSFMNNRYDNYYQSNRYYETPNPSYYYEPSSNMPFNSMEMTSSTAPFYPSSYDWNATTQQQPSWYNQQRFTSYSTIPNMSMNLGQNHNLGLNHSHTQHINQTMNTAMTGMSLPSTNMPLSQLGQMASMGQITPMTAPMSAPNLAPLHNNNPLHNNLSNNYYPYYMS